MVAFPVFLEDINRRMLSWGKDGSINPFKEVYEVTTLVIS